MWSVICALVGCPEVSEPQPVLGPEPTPAIAAAYAEVRQRVAQRHANLASEWATTPEGERKAVLERARTAATEAIVDDLIPAWVGTPWAFYGATETPRTGTIACGYFVSTVLRDAGFDVERIKLAQQASEFIILTMTPASRVSRYRGITRTSAAQQVEQLGEGLYIVGLDYHVGFLVKQPDTPVRMCHSDPTHGVICEDARSSSAFISDYRVVGPVLEDETVSMWLESSPFETVTR